MLIYFIYLIISIILIFVIFIGIKAAGRGIQAKNNKNISKDKNNENINNNLSKLNDLYKSGVITKKDFTKGEKKIKKKL